MKLSVESLSPQLTKLILAIVPNDETPYIAETTKLASTLGAAIRFYSANSLEEFHDAILLCAKNVLLVCSDWRFLREYYKGRVVTKNTVTGEIVTICQRSVLVIPSLQNLFSVAEGKFLFSHYLNKLLEPARWLPPIEFRRYTNLTTSPYADFLAFAKNSSLMAVDIETTGTPLGLRSIAFSCYDSTLGHYATAALEFTHQSSYSIAKALLALPVEKIFQNGIFDNFHLLPYSLIPTNWLWDTSILQHSLFPELPKRLDYLTSFYLLEGRYWKDLSTTDNLRYNAIDAFNTLRTFQGIMHYTRVNSLSYHHVNYKREFRHVFPCLASSYEGIRVDKPRLGAAQKEQTTIVASTLAELGTLVGNSDFNPGSPKQVKALLNILPTPKGKIWDSSDDSTLEMVKLLSPIHERIVNKIQTYRQSAKLVSTYCYPTLWNGDRLLYSFKTDGTETGRLSGQAGMVSYIESVANTGTTNWQNFGYQIQNLPTYAKKFLIADEGFEFAEIDKAQAESRGTGYLAQCVPLIEAVETSPDFHSHNASAFFGVPFDSIFNSVTGTVLNKALRDLAKRVNHGCNYNMMAEVLIQTMGLKHIYEAQKLLHLSPDWNSVQIANHLIIGFCKTYPELKGIEYSKLWAKYSTRKAAVAALQGTWYGRIIEEVETTGLLASPTGRVRRTFLNPRESKQDLNALVAHGPQSLNADDLEEGIWKVFNTLVGPNLRLKAEVHDSILFQFRTGHDYLIRQVQDALHNPIIIHGRTLVVPSTAPLAGSTHWA